MFVKIRLERMIFKWYEWKKIIIPQKVGLEGDLNSRGKTREMSYFICESAP